MHVVRAARVKGSKYPPPPPLGDNKCNYSFSAGRKVSVRLAKFYLTYTMSLKLFRRSSIILSQYTSVLRRHEYFFYLTLELYLLTRRIYTKLCSTRSLLLYCRVHILRVQLK